MITKSYKLEELPSIYSCSELVIFALRCSTRSILSILSTTSSVFFSCWETSKFLINAYTAKHPAIIHPIINLKLINLISCDYFLSCNISRIIFNSPRIAPNIPPQRPVNKTNPKLWYQVNVIITSIQQFIINAFNSTSKHITYYKSILVNSIKLVVIKLINSTSQLPTASIYGAGAGVNIEKGEMWISPTGPFNLV